MKSLTKIKIKTQGIIYTKYFLSGSNSERKLGINNRYVIEKTWIVAPIKIETTKYFMLFFSHDNHSEYRINVVRI